MGPRLEEDGRIFLMGTRLDGRPVLRACIINHRTQRADIDFMIRVLREVGGAAEAELFRPKG
ncbi:MAG: hypothetical protein ACI80V_000317 [Rhodothermales bacterium]|jgi:hypothetical protein